MRYVEVGGVKVSAVGLGCWQFGSMEWGYGKEYLEKDAIEIVHRALDLGITLIDTAEIYGFGKSERAVGRALEGRRTRPSSPRRSSPCCPCHPSSSSGAGPAPAASASTPSTSTRSTSPTRW